MRVINRQVIQMKVSELEVVPDELRAHWLLRSKLAIARNIPCHCSFWPYLNYHMPDYVLEGADERLLRVLGKHPEMAYG